MFPVFFFSRSTIDQQGRQQKQKASLSYTSYLKYEDTARQHLKKIFKTMLREFSIPLKPVGRSGRTYSCLALRIAGSRSYCEVSRRFTAASSTLPMANTIWAAWWGRKFAASKIFATRSPTARSWGSGSSFCGWRDSPF